MKKVLIVGKNWVEGSGWSYETDIDSIEVEETISNDQLKKICESFAKSFAENEEFVEGEDFKLNFYEDAEDGYGKFICEFWLSDFQNTETEE